MCDPVTIGVASLALGAGTAIDGRERARKQMNQQQKDQEEALKLQKEALDAQEKAATEANETSLAALATAQDEAAKNADLADQAMNKANAKQPNVGKLQGANVNAAKGGQSGTMLTGPQGVDTSTLTLGKATLLGAK